MLPPYGSCLLGSVNLTKFVSNPFTKDAKFEVGAYYELVKTFTRMLDNVVELNGLPLGEQQDEIYSKRRHGMGITGLGSALSMLGLQYGSEEAIKFTSEVCAEMACAGWETAVELAREKGPCPQLFNSMDRVLFIKSKYMERIFKEMPELESAILEHGARFTHHTSIAPTGTISLSVCNNVSNGIEPSFSHKYTRNVIKEGQKAKQSVDVYSYEALLYRDITGVDEIPDSFSTTDNITPDDHINMQAAAQYWVDSSISKTINVPTDMPFEDFKDIYMKAYAKGLKGACTFRFNPEAFQGVLVREEDLQDTTYIFETDQGEVEFQGNAMVEYEGGEYTAANLYDAIKEGFYGKF